MRIMLDTNVLISALLFPGTKMDAMMNYIFTNHQLVLSSYVVDELKNVVRRKLQILLERYAYSEISGTFILI